ncbi:MAG: GNAT family N-acetyltransferase [Mediterranea massiliensis]|nr:GNAT family N-acetyltransferase [Mediterranea massiliensis]
MLYSIAHYLRDKMPWLWNLINLLNSLLFSLRYGKRIKDFKFKTPHEGYSILPIREVATETLVEFFFRQPEEAFKFFKPHGFDKASIKNLQKNKAFLAYVLFNGDEIAGYCFNRSFFHGKGFRGRLVDINYRGKGLGTMMNKLLNEVGFGIGLRLFETVSKDNVASYRSALSASKVKVIEELEHNELYLEILKEQ